MALDNESMKSVNYSLVFKKANRIILMKCNWNEGSSIFQKSHGRVKRRNKPSWKGTAHFKKWSTSL